MDNHLATVGGHRYRHRMRWDHLFDDLAGQLEHELAAEEADLEREEERLRLGRLPLRERLATLRAAGGDDSRISYRDRLHSVRSLRLVTVGRDWMAGDLEGEGALKEQAIVPFWAVDALHLSPGQAERSLASAREPSELAARLSIAFLLRDLCRRRVPVTVHTSAATIDGTIDRVGRDHLDIAVHERDRPRRAAEVQSVRVVPFDQLLLVRL